MTSAAIPARMQGMTDDESILNQLSDWAATLTEPLLSARRRMVLEADLARIFAIHREEAQLFFAGLIADMILTLPDDDPWRNLASRGERPFGTWEDATDRVPLIHLSETDDPGLLALAGDDLSEQAVAVLAAAGFGWEFCRGMIDAICQAGPSDTEDFASVTDIATRDIYEHGAALHNAREACIQAVRWAVHRRRSYFMGGADAWPAESAFRWAWRAERERLGQAWNTEDVRRAIELERLSDPDVF